MGSGAVYVVNPSGGGFTGTPVSAVINAILNGAVHFLTIYTVPANKKCIVTSIMSYNTTRVTTRIQTGAEISGSDVWNYGEYNVPQNKQVCFIGTLYLVAGGKVRAYFNGGVAGDITWNMFTGLLMDA